MPIDRRALLRGVAGLAAGLILPPTLADNAGAVERRYWSLDQTMLGSGEIVVGPVFDAELPMPFLIESIGAYINGEWYPVYRGLIVVGNRQPQYEGAPYSSWTLIPLL